VLLENAIEQKVMEDSFSTGYWLDFLHLLFFYAGFYTYYFFFWNNK
jgi:hypothetical protein